MPKLEYFQNLTHKQIVAKAVIFISHHSLLGKYACCCKVSLPGKSRVSVLVAKILESSNIGYLSSLVDQGLEGYNCYTNYAAVYDAHMIILYLS